MINEINVKEREILELKQNSKKFESLHLENQNLVYKLRECEDLLEILRNERESEKFKNLSNNDNNDKDIIIKDLDQKLRNICRENNELIQILRENEPKVIFLNLYF